MSRRCLGVTCSQYCAQQLGQLGRVYYMYSVSTCAARPPLLPAARRRGGIRPGRGDVAEAVTAAVARSGTTPAPAKGAFTAEKRPLLPAGWLSVAGVILRLGHSSYMYTVSRQTVLSTPQRQTLSILLM